MNNVLQFYNFTYYNMLWIFVTVIDNSIYTYTAHMSVFLNKKCIHGHLAQYTPIRCYYHLRTY